MINVIDIFAGPGGLSEGFSQIKDNRGNRAFDIALSIEKEAYAFETLRLRAFFRQFPDGTPSSYYRFLRGEIGVDALYEAQPAAARVSSAKCWQALLGPGGETTEEVRRRINEVVGLDNNWVLIGGPPCQAYSLAGRSRNQGNPDYDPGADVRQKLYVEYLQILADHRPAVFIMENVKGLLSATLENDHIFHRILEDLRSPATAITRENRHTPNDRHEGYHIYSLVERRLFENGNLEGSVIRSENYGIPQARHRVILLGIRDDIHGVTPGILVPRPPVSVSRVINHLPNIRSGLSRHRDSGQTWVERLHSQLHSRWANAGTRRVDSAELSDLVRQLLGEVRAPDADRGAEFISLDVAVDYMSDWYSDQNMRGICNHSSRAHMEKDLYRYFYAACYARLHGISPSLQHFPTDLIPYHTSAVVAVEEGGNFSDRFRVQVSGRPSTTIVSHISKDGHYYIHPDPLQCRSLTVREAARLQTFPDNYFFSGPKTAQYVQVGNAVPPYLAKQIADIVYRVLSQGGA
jgi:DNA (cytosine-5)-methyltransferase 1